MILSKFCETSVSEAVRKKHGGGAICLLTTKKFGFEDMGELEEVKAKRLLQRGF